MGSSYKKSMKTNIPKCRILHDTSENVTQMKKDLRTDLFRQLENQSSDSKKAFADIPIKMNMRPEDLEEEYHDDFEGSEISHNDFLASIAEDEEESDKTTLYGGNRKESQCTLPKIEHVEDTSFIKGEKLQAEINSYSTKNFLNDLIKLVFKQSSFSNTQDSEYDINLFDEKLERKVHFLELMILLANGVCMPSFTRLFT